MNDFLKKVDIAKQRPDRFWAMLVNSLDKHKVPSSELFDDLDDNCAEIGDLLEKSIIYPSQVYYFDYRAKEDESYQKKMGKKVVTQTFTDTSPLVLVLADLGKVIRGINLNLCTNDLKALILNVFVGIDPDYFNGGYAKLCANKELPLSRKVLSFLQDGGEKRLKDALKRLSPHVDYDFIFRNYSRENIKNAQIVAPYMWPYLPGISYGGEMKGKVISTLQHMTGIDTIHLH